MTDDHVFTGTVSEQGDWTLTFPAQAKAWCRQIAKGTTEIEVLIRPARRDKSRAQEKGFHAMIAPWAKERGWRPDTLKQFLLKIVFGTLDFIDPRTGEIVQVLAEPSTAKLTRAKYSELIEGAMQLAADDSFFLTAPDEYHAGRAA